MAVTGTYRYVRTAQRLAQTPPKFGPARAGVFFTSLLATSFSVLALGRSLPFQQAGHRRAGVAE